MEYFFFHFRVQGTLVITTAMFRKMLPSKQICCCKKYLMSRMICKKGLLLFLFFHRTYVFLYLLESPQWGNSNKYPKHMFLEVLKHFSCTISDELSPNERRFCVSQIVNITDFVGLFGVGIRRVDFRSVFRWKKGKQFWQSSHLCKCIYSP